MVSATDPTAAKEPCQVDRAERTYIEQRVILLRRELGELARFGRGSNYYEEHLAKLEGIARKTREHLERTRLQLTIGE